MGVIHVLVDCGTETARLLACGLKLFTGGLYVMLRSAVFIDYLNFSLAVKSLYQKKGCSVLPKLDYTKIGELAVKKLSFKSELVKSHLCAPKPDKRLMDTRKYSSEYAWLSSLRNKKRFDVIEGTLKARPINSSVEINVNDLNTYYVVEKGTDINMAVESLKLAYNNSLDAAIFISGDSDYLPIYKALRSIGKLVCVVVVQDQYIQPLIPEIDDYAFLNIEDLESIVRGKIAQCPPLTAETITR